MPLITTIIRQRRKKWLFLLQLFLFSIAISGDASKIILDGKDEEQQQELSFTEISKLRAREIKRRLVRKHGYTSEEVAQMIDKKILIETLAYEEHLRLRRRNSDKQRRRLQKSIMIALFTVAVILFWPLIQMAIRQLYEIVSVNFIIYTDRKLYEFGRCKEFNCYPGFIGLGIVMVLDILLLWLNATTTLSWVLPSTSIYRKYFFPIPNIPIRAGETGFALNIGGVLVIWFLIWIKSNVLERFVAKRLLAAQQYRKDLRKQHRKEARRLARDGAANTTTTQEKQKQENIYKNTTVMEGGVTTVVKNHTSVSRYSLDSLNMDDQRQREQQSFQDTPVQAISSGAVEDDQTFPNVDLMQQELQCDYIREEQEQVCSFMEID